MMWVLSVEAILKTQYRDGCQHCVSKVSFEVIQKMASTWQLIPSIFLFFFSLFICAVSMLKWIFDVKLDLLLAIDMTFVLLFAYVSVNMGYQRSNAVGPNGCV